MSSMNLASPDKTEIRRIFDRIAFRYDFLNSFLSLRLDDYWRRRARDLVLEGSEESILDLGLGTGKFLEVFLDSKSWEKAAGLDFSFSMLEVAGRHMAARVHRVAGDFHALPFQDKTFDLVISAFTLRSVKDMPLFLSEVYRLLCPGGKAVFLCLTRPRHLAAKLAYYPYLKFYLPLVGRLVSGDSRAYHFLSQSIEHFQKPEDTAGDMRQAGFHSVALHFFTLGLATLFVGKK